MTNLRDLLEQRAERGEARGPDAIAERAVWEAMSAKPTRRNPLPFLAAAAVVVIALLAGVLALTGDDGKKTDTRVATSPGTTANTADGWQKTAAAPIAGRVNAAMASDHSHLFVWGGWDPASQTEFNDGALYDPQADTWQTVPAPPFEMHGPNAAAVWDGSRYLVVAGMDDGPGMVFAAYDPAERAWAQLPGPGEYRDGFQLTWGDRTLFLTGGGGGDTIATPFALEYDPASSTWIELPQPFPSYASSAVVWDWSALVAVSGAKSSEPNSASPQSPVPGAAYVPGEGWHALPDGPNRHLAVMTSKGVIAGAAVHTDHGARFEPALLSNDRQSWTALRPIALDSYPLWVLPHPQRDGYVIVTQKGGVDVANAESVTSLPQTDLTGRSNAIMVDNWLVLWGGVHDTSAQDTALADGVKINLASGSTDAMFADCPNRRGQAGSSPATFDPDQGTYAALAKSFDARSNSLAFDVVQLLSGEDANRAYEAESGDSRGVPNDYYVLNTSDQIRVATVSDDADVEFLDRDGNAQLRRASVEDLGDHLTLSMQKLYWLTFSHREITAICQQYTP